MTAIRVLVTGSRTWDDVVPVARVLEAFARTARTERRPLVVVHGAAPRGADLIASGWVQLRAAKGWPVTEEPHPADWQGPKKRGAGYARNAEMVLAGADAAAAFIRDDSRGATHCLELIEAAGIPVVVVRWEHRDSPLNPTPKEMTR